MTYLLEIIPSDHTQPKLRLINVPLYMAFDTLRRETGEVKLIEGATEFPECNTECYIAIGKGYDCFGYIARVRDDIDRFESDFTNS